MSEIEVEARAYSLGEEIANSVSHGLGFLVALAATPWLIWTAVERGTIAAVVGVSVFATTLMLMFITSTLYHALPHPRLKPVLRLLDHNAIFLLIAGTYTPLSLVALGGGWGWTLFGCVWFLAAVGVVLNTVAHGRWRWLSITLYLAMGWLVVVAIKPLVAALDTRELVLVAAGGVLYTFGLVFYGSKKLPYAHAVWHVFVLAASVLHYLAVLFAVGMTP